MDNSARLMDPAAVAKAVARLAINSKSFQVVTASTASIGEVVAYVVPTAMTLTSITYTSATGSAPATGSSQTLIVTKYDGAGGAGATMASGAIANATPLVANVPFDLGTLTDAACAAGTVLTFKSTLSGTGTVPVGTLTFNETTD